jgi:hypothetical protein
MSQARVTLRVQSSGTKVEVAHLRYPAGSQFLISAPGLMVWVRGRRSDRRLREMSVRRERRALEVGQTFPWFFPRRAGRCFVATATRSRSKPRKPHVRSPIQSDRHRETISPQVSPLLPQVARDPEPLEKGVRGTEAPEAWQTYHSEAPDAGRGQDFSDQETFTLGRSRS